MEEKTETVSKEKRLALLRYLEILFLVAFVLVVISLFIQMRSTNTTISNLTEASESMLSRAETLQEENRELTQELQAAKAETEDLRIAYEALSAVLASPYTEQTVEHAKEIETVYNYKSFYSESAWALFEAYLAHVSAS